MKATGTIEITDELTLVNPTMEVRNITYSWSGDNKVAFELIFKGEGQIREDSRRFEFTNTDGGYMSGEDAWNMIATHDTLKVFNTEENTSWIQSFINFFTSN
jgi:hypothetical protein